MLVSIVLQGGFNNTAQHSATQPHPVIWCYRGQKRLTHTDGAHMHHCTGPPVHTPSQFQCACHERLTYRAITTHDTSWPARLQLPAQGPAVGVFPLQRGLTDSWFVEDSSSKTSRGMGGRSCSNLREVAATEKLDENARAAFLISHRCRCGDSPAEGVPSACAEKEQLADACAMSGRTPFREDPRYVPDRH